MKTLHQCLFAFVLAVVSVFTGAQTSAAGDDIPANFYQHSEQLAASGLVSEGGLEALKAQGYEQIIDLRSAAEQPESEGEAAKQLGLKWLNFPMTGELASAEQIQQFGAALGNGKTLVHCRSGNRVGMAWSLWQISQGVELEQALAEGRAMGMKDGFEQAIRAQQR